MVPRRGVCDQQQRPPQTSVLAVLPLPPLYTFAPLEVNSDILATTSVGVHRACDCLYLPPALSSALLQCLRRRTTNDTIVNHFSEHYFVTFPLHMQKRRCCQVPGLLTYGGIHPGITYKSNFWVESFNTASFPRLRRKLRGPTTVTNTEDYQPQGTDISVYHPYDFDRSGVFSTACFSPPPSDINILILYCTHNTIRYPWSSRHKPLLAIRTSSSGARTVWTHSSAKITKFSDVVVVL